MVTGPMRLMLWILGSVGVLWLMLGVVALAQMGRMMGGAGEGSGVMDGGMMGGEWMMGMMSMMGVMGLQLVGMLGLVGIFVYLVMDSARRRRAAPQENG